MSDAPVRPTFRFLRVMTWVVVAGAVVGAVVGGGASLLYLRVRQTSGSMWPTYEPGETCWARRGSQPPALGEVVAFRYPERPEQLFAKRVVARAGDVLTEQGDGTLAINGWAIPRCVVGAVTWNEPDGSHAGTLALEFLGATSYFVFDDAGAPRGEPGRTWTVEPGAYFVVGDNRRNSHDSRTWNMGVGGGVPIANTEGVLPAPAPAKLLASLPPSITSQKAAVDACLAKRPATTLPPAPR